MDIPFTCHVNPGGAYFKAKQMAKPAKDRCYAFRVRELGWGYGSVTPAQSYSIAEMYQEHDLVVIHKDHLPLGSEVLHQVDEFVLYSPTGQIYNL